MGMTAIHTEPYALAHRDGTPVPGAMPGVQMLVKAGAATGAPFTLLQGSFPSQWAPLPHVHADEDELFYVLAGRLTVRCGNSIWHLEQGDMAFCPRGIMHMPSTDPGQEATALLLTSRPGLEQFFAELAECRRKLGDTAGPPSIEFLDQIGEKYGLTSFPADAFDNLR